MLAHCSSLSVALSTIVVTSTLARFTGRPIGATCTAMAGPGGARSAHWVAKAGQLSMPLFMTNKRSHSLRQAAALSVSESPPPVDEAAGLGVGMTGAGGSTGTCTIPRRRRLRVGARARGRPALLPSVGVLLNFSFRQIKHWMQLAARGTWHETTYQNIIPESDRMRAHFPGSVLGQYLLER